MVVVVPIGTVLIVAASFALVWLAMITAIAVAGGASELAASIVGRLGFASRSSANEGLGRDNVASELTYAATGIFFVYYLVSGMIFGMKSVAFMGLQNNLRQMIYELQPGLGFDWARILSYLALTGILMMAVAFLSTLIGVFWRQYIDRLPGILPSLAFNVSAMLVGAWILNFLSIMRWSYSLPVVAALICFNLWKERHVYWFK